MIAFSAVVLPAPLRPIRHRTSPAFSSNERSRSTVREVARETTILLIEHNMDVVMELAQRITVMENGAILADGSPAEITANPEVQRAYLGT